MYTYLTRKVQIALDFGTSTRDLEKVSQQELQEIPNKPTIFFTRNPFSCWTDTAEDVKYIEKKNSIRVCNNLIQSEIFFRASLAREIFWISQKKAENDDLKAQNVIKACKKEMDQIQYLDKTTRELATKTCAKIHSKRKIENKKNRNVDVWHFYTRQLVEDNWFIYSNL